MAKVPVGNFGFTAPTLAPAPSVQLGAFVGRGMSEAAEGFGNVASAVAGGEIAEARQQYLEFKEREAERKQLERERQAEEKRLMAEARRAEATTIHATAQNDLNAAHDEILNGLQTGSIKRNEAPRIWEERSRAITDSHLERVDRSNVELVKAGLIGVTGTLGRQINKGVVLRAQQDIGTNLNATLEELQRAAVTDPAAVRRAEALLDSMGPQAGLNPEQIGKQKQAFKEGAAFNGLTAALNANRTSVGGLRQVIAAVQKNGDLDPVKKNALLNSAQTQILHLSNVAEAAERRRLGGAERAIDALNRQITAGVAVDPKTWASVQSATRGTPYAQLLEGLMGAERETQALLSKPIPEQIAAVNRAEAAALAGGGGMKEKLLADRLGKTVRQNIQMLTQTPLVYAVQRQGADGTPLDMQNAASWGDILMNRLNAVDPLAKQHGVAKRLLYPQEAQAFAQTIQSAPTAQAAELFARLKKAIPDPKAYRDTVAQIAPDDPVTAYAGGLFGKTKGAVREGFFSNTAAPDPQVVARTLLEGRRVLAPTKGEKGEDGNRKGMFRMPAEKDFDAEFESATKGIYAGNPEARSMDYQATRAYYAGKASQHGKYDGVIDSSLVRDAVTAVIGGISTKHGRVIRPYGMPEDQFRDSVRKGWLQIVVDNKLPASLRDARIQLRNGPREGAYYVMDGTKFLSGADGAPVMLQVAP